MEHSTAIMEDAGKAVEKAAKQSNNAAPHDQGETGAGSSSNAYDEERQSNNYNRRKRKGDFPDSRQKYGSKGGRGGRGGHNDNKRYKKGDMGRGEYFRDQPDKRAKNDEAREKRLNGNATTYGTTFSKEEIDAEERKPKRKVAVLIGYSGTGYKGMQITPSERTIEGDLFQALVAAGAISKANADDPKKASLVRCARTDKGVHAAGNMISLKLIVEEDDIVEKINSHLSSQIRVWGIERTIGSFSCYQACDSRWYEYLIPSHAFLPPHPSSWMAKKMEELADEAGDRAGYDSRQEEVKGFWEKVDENDIKPVLETIDEDIRWEVVKALQGEDEASAKATKADADVDQPIKAGKSVSKSEGRAIGNSEKTEEAAIIINEPAAVGAHDPKPTDEAATTDVVAAPAEDTAPVVEGMVDSAASHPGVQLGEDDKPQASGTTTTDADQPKTDTAQDTRPSAPQISPEELERHARLKAATKKLRNAYIAAKRRYRIPKQRIDRIQSALNKFVGTANYHNYTVQKTFRDPSAKRHIKSFVVNPQAILIGEGPGDEKSEWLSLKVHGQSFMMHQIRKMIGMVTLLVRCGSNLNTMNDSLQEEKFSIPKVPGLGLLLERPVFDSYNTIQAVKHQREPLRFDKYEKELEAFKQREIYQRIFREEEEKNEFGRFFNHVDNFKEPYFLFVTSKGVEATKGVRERAGVASREVEGSDDEGGDEGGEE